MICPNKICRQEIPDDSCFCDKCGIQLLKCPNCGSIGISKFCSKCGTRMDALVFQRALSEENPAETPVSTEPPVPSASVSPGATVIIPLPSAEKQIKLQNSDGWEIVVNPGDILGRTAGPHCKLLGQFPVISSHHARIDFTGGVWSVTDTHSTNKTYLNNQALVPDVSAQIQDGDVITLANIAFTVRIK